MAVKEHTRKEKERSKKPAKKVESVNEHVPAEHLKPVHHVRTIRSKSVGLISVKPVTSVEKSSAKTTEIEMPLPQWGGPDEKPWMYIIPNNDEGKLQWAEEWSDYLLFWAQKKAVHVLSVASFIAEPPFKDIFGKVEAFKLIAERLVEKGVAEWLDKKKHQIRIYWRPLEEWADVIYDWALKKGHTRLDVKSIVIQQSEEPFAGLPEQDLKQIMSMLVEKGVAEWVSKKKGAVKLVL